MLVRNGGGEVSLAPQAAEGVSFGPKDGNEGVQAVIEFVSASGISTNVRKKQETVQTTGRFLLYTQDPRHDRVRTDVAGSHRRKRVVGIRECPGCKIHKRDAVLVAPCRNGIVVPFVCGHEVQRSARANPQRFHGRIVAIEVAQKLFAAYKQGVATFPGDIQKMLVGMRSKIVPIGLQTGDGRAERRIAVEIPREEECRLDPLSVQGLPDTLPPIRKLMPCKHQVYRVLCRIHPHDATMAVD